MFRQAIARKVIHRIGQAAIALALTQSPALAEDGAPRLLTLLGIGSAAVAPSHSAFGALSYSTRSDLGGTFVDADDASAALGYVLGDAGTGVGLQFGVNFTGLASDPSFSGLGPGRSGYFSLQAAHLISAKVPVFVAVSADHLSGWGRAKDINPALAAMVTVFPTIKLGDQAYPMMLTLGIGDHIRNAGNDPGGFAGLGMGLTPNFGASVAWTGETVTIGGTYKNAALKNWNFSAQLDDALNQKDGRRVTLSATILFENAFGG